VPIDLAQDTDSAQLTKVVKHLGVRDAVTMAQQGKSAPSTLLRQHVTQQIE